MSPEVLRNYIIETADKVTNILMEFQQATGLSIVELPLVRTGKQHDDGEIVVLEMVFK